MPETSENLNAPVTLLAVEPLPRGDWIEPSERAYVNHGYQTRRVVQSLLVWNDVRTFGDIDYSDGHAVSRLWLAPGRWALALTPRRLYFDGQDLDPRPEREIVGSTRPKASERAQQIEAALNAFEVLARDARNPEPRPVGLEAVSAPLETARRAIVGDAVAVVPPDGLNDLYKRHGFELTPQVLAIAVCPLDGTPDRVTQDVAGRIEQAARARGLAARVSRANIGALVERAQVLRETETPPAAGRCVLFVLPSKDQRPSSSAIELMDQLDSIRVPYRRCYADDPFNFSVPDQFPSILQACGGLPHSSPTTAGETPVWTIGIDLGHPQGAESSRVAMTLVDPKGRLVGAWTTSQRRDETVKADSLVRLLEGSSALYKEEASTNEGLVVMRDGRHFANERTALYGEMLGSSTSVLECRKRRNPLMLVGGTLAGDRAPFAGKVPGARTMFLVSAPPRLPDQLPNVLKLAWDDDMNGLRLDAASIAELVTASAAAPGLGLHPHHLPAALYWADGIASASDHDLRFRGIPVFRV